jgi:hypothetical protein
MTEQPDVWAAVRRLNVRLSARRFGVVPPLTALAAAATLVGDDDVRFADVTAEVDEDFTRWRIVVLTERDLVTVEAASHLAGWSYEHPGPDAEATALPTVDATIRRLAAVTAVHVAGVPAAWLPRDDDDAPAPPVRLEFPGGEVTLPLGRLRHRDWARRAEDVRTVLALVGAAR